MRKPLAYSIFLLFLMFIAPARTFSQELYCNVQVSAQQIQGSNREIFNTMQKAIYDFMNNTVWTSMVVSYAERIDCNLLINLNEQLSADEFRGTVQVQLSRPAFNTTYNSTMLNFIDNSFQFRYVEFQPLEFDPNVHRSSLTSVLAYYAYIIIGMDADSYSPEGGTEFYQIAEKIVNNAQNAPEQGWKPFDGSRNRNRYWLVKNMLDREYAPVRKFIYDYHINGLDRLESRIGEARVNIEQSLRNLQQVYRKRPDPYMYYFSIVVEAKNDEVVRIFTGAFPEEKARIVEIMTEIDPANKAKYEKINTGVTP